MNTRISLVALAIVAVGSQANAQGFDRGNIPTPRGTGAIAPAARTIPTRGQPVTVTDLRPPAQYPRPTPERPEFEPEPPPVNEAIVREILNRYSRAHARAAAFCPGLRDQLDSVGTANNVALFAGVGTTVVGGVAFGTAVAHQVQQRRAEQAAETANARAWTPQGPTRVDDFEASNSDFCNRHPSASQDIISIANSRYSALIEEFERLVLESDIYTDLQSDPRYDDRARFATTVTRLASGEASYFSSVPGVGQVTFGNMSWTLQAFGCRGDASYTGSGAVWGEFVPHPPRPPQEPGAPGVGQPGAPVLPPAPPAPGQPGIPTPGLEQPTPPAQQQRSALVTARTATAFGAGAISGVGAVASFVGVSTLNRLVENMNACDSYVREIRGLREELAEEDPRNPALAEMDNIISSCTGLNSQNIIDIRGRMIATGAISATGAFTGITGGIVSAVAGGQGGGGPGGTAGQNMAVTVLTGATAATGVATTALSGTILSALRRNADVVLRCSNAF